ncbi:hypothetical protein EI94DRAFT_1744374 [Lactarius quietus]|nr:hypothetical protein EI94DRAFT_1744374 [Lactarius quietus]
MDCTRLSPSLNDLSIEHHRPGTGNGGRVGLNPTYGVILTSWRGLVDYKSLQSHYENNQGE